MKPIQTKLGQIVNFYNGAEASFIDNGEYTIYGSNGPIGKSRNFNNENAIIVGRVGAYCGSIEIEKNKFWASDNTIVIKPKSDNNLEYLSYLLISTPLRSYAGGAAQPLLTHTILRTINLRFFGDSRYQQKIASTLFAYDDLIEINHRRIQLLEESARLLYREWFVYFRFPGHEKVKIVDGVPEGWRKGSLEDITTIKKGRNITFEQAIEGNIPVVGGGLEPTYYHNKANVCAPVITISASGANAGYVNLYHSDVWASDCSYMNRETTKHIFYLFLMLKSLQAYLTGLQVGVAQPHVYPKDLNRSKVLIPSDDICERFELLVTPMFDLIKNLKHHNQNLAQARDFLLPRLMNGKIDVSEIDIEVAQEAEA